MIAGRGRAAREFRATVDVNLVAAFHLCQVVGRQMLAQGEGNIVNVASMLGTISAGQIPQAGYAASKAGLINLSRDLAAQWGRKGDPGQRPVPGLVPERDDERDVRRRAVAGLDPAQDDPGPARAARTSSTAPCCGWPATPAPT